MQVIHSWDKGDITEDNIEKFKEFFEKLNPQKSEVTLRPLSEEVLLKIEKKFIPKSVKRIKLINLVDENKSSDDELFYVLSDQVTHKFINLITGIDVEVIKGVRQKIPPPQKPQKEVFVQKTHYNLDVIEEKFKTYLNGFIAIEQGFTHDSPHNSDREFGVYDSVEVTFKAPESQQKVTFVFDRFNHKVMVFYKLDKLTAIDLDWVDNQINEIASLV